MLALSAGWPVTAADVTSTPLISFGNTAVPDRVAAGFATINDHADEVTYVSSIEPGCNYKVYRVDGTRAVSSFASLPRVCAQVDVDVNTDGTSPWENLFHVFIAQGRNIWIVSPASAGINLGGTAPSIQLTAGHCPDGIFAIGLSPAGGPFGGRLLVQCTVGGEHSKFLAISSTGGVTELASLDGSGYHIFDFAPQNWRTHPGKLLVFENSSKSLVALSPTGLTRIALPGLDLAAISTARVYGIPSLLMDLFAGESSVFGTSNTSPNRLDRWTSAEVQAYRGSVLLWGNGGERFIAKRDGTNSPLTHAAAGSDGDWGPLQLQSKLCDAAAFSKPNTGAKGTINCTAFSTDEFDAVADIDWDTVYCGVTAGFGNEAQATFKGARDANKDGLDDAEFYFDAKETELANNPGTVPICTFMFNNPHGGGM